MKLNFIPGYITPVGVGEDETHPICSGLNMTGNCRDSALGKKKLYFKISPLVGPHLEQKLFCPIWPNFDVVKII